MGLEVHAGDAVAWALEVIARYGDDVSPKEKGGPQAA
jgi:hypothetical protein